MYLNFLLSFLVALKLPSTKITLFKPLDNPSIPSPPLPANKSNPIPSNFEGH